MRPKINLRAEMARVGEHRAADLTFAELTDSYCAVQFDGADLRLRKWVEAFGPLSAWSLTTRDLSLAAEAMLQSGQYQPSTVNRDTSTIGTIYNGPSAATLPRPALSPLLSACCVMKNPYAAWSFPTKK